MATCKACQQTTVCMQLKECRMIGPNEDRGNPHICPIPPFLALAYEHCALSIDRRHLFPETRDKYSSVHIPFNEAVLNTPFFRSEGPGPTPWTHNASGNMSKRPGESADYQCGLSQYCVRRGAANLLSSMSFTFPSMISISHLLALHHPSPPPFHLHSISKQASSRATTARSSTSIPGRSSSSGGGHALLCLGTNFE